MDERAKILLAVPNGGILCSGMAESHFELGREGHPFKLIGRTMPSSTAGPTNYLICLAEAMDLRDQGLCTHMAYQFQDCQPLTYDWLAILYREMQEHGAHFVAANIPIKDLGEYVNPRTSTAVGLRSDPWRGAIRYVHVQDRHTMPTTFGPEYLCRDPDEVLYLNLHLALCDLRHEAWDYVAAEGFNFFSRVVLVPTGDDKYRRCVQQRSEDWEISRCLQDHGAVVRATWAVPVRHLGGGYWDSHVEPVPAPTEPVPAPTEPVSVSTEPEPVSTEPVPALTEPVHALTEA